MNKKNKNLVYIIGMIIIIAIATTALFVAMHLSGYNLVTWLQKFWPWIVVITCAAVLGGISLFFLKERKK